jgi:hypothetical protein
MPLHDLPKKPSKRNFEIYYAVRAFHRKQHEIGNQYNLSQARISAIASHVRKWLLAYAAEEEISFDQHNFLARDAYVKVLEQYQRKADAAFELTCKQQTEEQPPEGARARWIPARPNHKLLELAAKFAKEKIDATNSRGRGCYSIEQELSADPAWRKARDGRAKARKAKDIEKAQERDAAQRASLLLNVPSDAPPAAETPANKAPNEAPSTQENYYKPDHVWWAIERKGPPGYKIPEWIQPPPEGTYMEFDERSTQLEPLFYNSNDERIMEIANNVVDAIEGGPLSMWVTSKQTRTIPMMLEVGLKQQAEREAKKAAAAAAQKTEAEPAPETTPRGRESFAEEVVACGESSPAKDSRPPVAAPRKPLDPEPRPPARQLSPAEHAKRQELLNSMRMKITPPKERLSEPEA